MKSKKRKRGVQQGFDIHKEVDTVIPIFLETCERSGAVLTP